MSKKQDLEKTLISCHWAASNDWKEKPR